MKLDLDGRTVLVTGGTRGIGFACAKLFLEEGARVAIVGRSAEALSSAMEELGAPADYLVGIAADLIDADKAAAMVAEVEARLGPIDVLVGSAGAAKRTPPDELSPAAYRAAMDAKFFSYVNVIDPVVKGMAARGSGAIVSVIGNGGKAASPVHIPGGAANAALMLATAGLAAAYAGRGVRVVAVNPGLTKTGRVAEGLKSDARFQGITEAEAAERANARIPMGRMAEPEEIAAMVAFLASPRASYVTGVAVTMDGAQSPLVV